MAEPYGISTGSYEQEQPRKSKILLLLIHLLGGGYLGLDRMYMGCWQSGLIKMLLFVVGVVLLFSFFPSNNDAEPVKYPMALWVGFVCLMVSYIWVMLDLIWVLINAASGSTEVPWTYCDNAMWRNEGDITCGQYLAFFLIGVTVLTQGGVFNAFLPV